MERPNAWKDYQETDLQRIAEIGNEYRDMISRCKTEREWTREIVRRLEDNGYISLEKARKENRSLAPGDKVYVSIMGKAVLSFYIGKTPLEDGMNIVGAHIDSPRLDLKQNPLYEDSDLAYGDTHYYGGIKKYQWVARPLALHGVIAKKDGSLVDLLIGEDENEPVVGISDLLIHLAQEQMGKKLSEGVAGEDLDLILAGQPLPGAEKDSVKAMLLKILLSLVILGAATGLSVLTAAISAVVR